MDYIDITNDLKIGDYYRTDLHWKQENLTQVADKILKSMDNDKKRNDAYRKKYLRISTVHTTVNRTSNIKPDKLTYLNDKQ